MAQPRREFGGGEAPPIAQGPGTQRGGFWGQSPAIGTWPRAPAPILFIYVFYPWISFTHLGIFSIPALWYSRSKNRCGRRLISAGPLWAHGCAAALPVLSSCHSVPFWSVQSCLLAYCGVLISVFLFSGLPAICLLVASGPRGLQFTST